MPPKTAVPEDLGRLGVIAAAVRFAADRWTELGADRKNGDRLGSLAQAQAARDALGALPLLEVGG